MSAVAGLVRRGGGDAGVEDLRPALEHMRGRIRGDWIVWSRGPVVLAAGPPVDAASAAPPFAEEPDGLARVADARPDGAAPAPRANGGPAEPDVLLGAYRSGGLGAVGGDFAVGLWDARRRRLVGARDGLGTKPLYFVETEAFFAFATEPGALARLPGVDAAPDPLMIAHHLALRPYGFDRSFYRGVRPVPQGAAVSCDAGGVRVHLPRAAEPRTDEATADAAASRMRSLLERAIARALPSEGPWGVSLSGGLDSSAVAGVAARVAAPGAGPGRGYTAIFDASPESDERDYALAVCRFAGLDSVLVPAEAVGPLDAYERLVGRLPGPWLTPNLHVVRSVYRAASGDGVRVLLDGHDGDTVVSHGLNYLPELLRHGRLVEYVRRGSGVARTLGWGRRAMVRAHLRRVVRHSSVGRAFGAAPGAPRPTSIMSAGLARSAEIDERLSSFADPYPDERSAHGIRVRSGVLAYMSEASAAAASTEGIDCRHPFLDADLVDACLATPSRLKLGGGLTRKVLRDALVGAVPEDVRLRPRKTLLGAQFRRAFLLHDRERVAALVHGDVPELAEYVDLPRFAALWAGFEDGRPGGEMEIWAAATLGVWLARR